MSPDLLARFGFFFYRHAEWVPARTCLERAAESEGPWQPKSMLVLAQAFIALENENLAGQILEKVVSQFPGTLFDDEAGRLLSGLR